MSRCITEFAQACTDLADMTARKDGAYLERNRCVALIARMALASGWRAGIARTAIEGWSEDWHGCVYVDLPTGQTSWHFHDSQAHLFADLPDYTGAWDGHDTPEKYRRVGEAFPVAASAPSGEPVEYLFVQMDDDGHAWHRWCTNHAEVREAVKAAMFFVADGEELSAEHTDQLDASVDVLIDDGRLSFEGDPPLYLFRMAGAAWEKASTAQAATEQEGG